MTNRQPRTIFTKICIPLFIVMLLQSAIFYTFTVHGSTVNTLNSNATDILTERVANRQNELTSTFTSRWTNMGLYNDMLNKLYVQYAASHDTAFYADPQQKKDFIVDASSTLFTMLRSNSVSGVFMILANSDTYQPVSETPQSYYGLCVRDYGIGSAYTDKEDLLILRCPTSTATKLDCSLDSCWDALFTFSSSDHAGDYFYEPLRVAYDNPGGTYDNLAYFSGPHIYSESDRPVVSYSIPLISPNGHIYGVLGVELTTDYLSTLLPNEELAGKNASTYMLVQYDEGDTEFSVVASSGTLFQRCIGSDQSFQLDMSHPIGNTNVYVYTGKQDLTLCCAVSPLSIYNRNTPFENKVFALVGAVNEDELFSVSNEIRNSLLIVTLVVICIGFISIFAVSHLLSRPIKRLGARVKAMEPNEDAKLEHINILEIDQLVDAIEMQGQAITRSVVRTEFFSRMSHDMRTPMNAIIGFSSPEILENCDKPQLLDYLSKINASGNYLLGLINEVLDMTKIDSGRMELEAKPFCLNDIWAGIAPMVDKLSVQRGVTFIKDLPAERGETVLGDLQRLSQIFVNLLSNSIKFTPAGGTVTLSVHETKTPSGQLACCITVSDTGIGMSEEFQEKMFQPFTQEHPGREGTGLGLSIAYQLVKQMHGTISCISRQNEGTTFTVDLTFTPAPGNAMDAETTRCFSDDDMNRILSGRRILLCEDHPLNRQIACNLLNRQNIRVDTAENGKLGTEMFRQSATGYYDAVLMDIRMPEMDGLEATRVIRAMPRSDAQSIPIIAMTANAFQEDMDASAAAGMNAHLAKPIEPQNLYETLCAQLECTKCDA